MDKALKTSLSLPESLRNRAQLLADTTHRGNLSGLVQECLRAALANEPAPTAHDEHILEKLAVTYFGYHAPKFAGQLREHGADQPALLHELLCQLSECFACGTRPEDIVVAPRWALERGDQLAAAEDQAAYLTAQLRAAQSAATGPTSAQGDTSPDTPPTPPVPRPAPPGSGD